MLKFKGIGLSIILISVLAQAENINNLDEVTVTTATKTKKNIEGVSASVIVIDEKTIKKMGAANLGDIISKTPGLTKQYGAFPSASDKSRASISIRGIGATGTLFLINGERLAGEIDKQYELDRIPASEIERIEIVKGPMSTLYGADAVGGVVNIITKQPKEGFQGSFGVQSGTNMHGNGQNHNAYIDLRGKKNKLKYSFYVNKAHSTPYTQREIAHVLVPDGHGGKEKPSQNPKFKKGGAKDTYDTDVTYREKANVFNVGTNLGYEITDTLNTDLSLSYMDEKRWGTYIGNVQPSGYKNKQGKPIPVFNVPINSKDHNTRRNISGDLKWNASDNLFLKLKIYNNYYKKRKVITMKHWKDFGFNSEDASAANGTNANVDITSYELSGNYVLNDAHLLTFGTEDRSEKRKSSVFDPTSKISTKTVNYKAIYLQDEWEVSDTFNVISGARYDDISDADSKPTFKLGAVKNFSKLFNLRANFAQGYRTPSLMEIYLNKQIPAGLIQGAKIVGYNLKPEFTNAFEIGTSGRYEGFAYDIDAFLNKIKNRIQRVSGKKSNTWTFVNVSNAETKGMDLTLSYDFGNGLDTQLTWNELRTEDKKTGKDLEFNPDRTISFKTDYSVTKNFNLGLLATYTGEEHYTKKTLAGKVDMTTNAFTLVDLTTSYKFGKAKKYEVYGGVNNLFNKKVDDILGSNVGTYVYAGLRMKF